MNLIELEKWFIEFHSIIDLFDKINFIYNSIDEFLRNEKFWLIDNILDKLNCTKLSITENLAFLSITLAAKENLNTRNSFYNKFENYLILIGESNERIKELLHGLE